MKQATKPWQGQWIWKDNSRGLTGQDEHQLVYFRKTFEWSGQEIEGLHLYATADSRYRFYINGKSVSVGPCKGHAHVHYYESVPLAAMDILRPGMNVLAVEVLHYAGLQPFAVGQDGPLSIWRSQTGGLLAELIMTNAEGQQMDQICSDESWRCYPNPAYRLIPDPLVRWMGGMEHVAGKDIPQGWLAPEYDDSAWLPAVAINAGGDEYGQLGPWNLTERPIPPLYETERAFTSVVRRSSEADKDGTAVLIAEAGSHAWIELDAGELTTGYLRLALEGGAGSQVKLLCAESYELEGSVAEQRRKGVRDQDHSWPLVGSADRYEPAGNGIAGKEEGYEPFWFRTFRYVRVEVLAGSEPLVIRAVSYRETGYPLEVQASFTCSDERYNQLWDLSLRTLQRCMHETYEDCPYYEQLQYAMDTKLMMQFTYLIAGDDRLARRAMEDFRASQLPDGMLQSRYPSVMPQIIPSFSLYWIHMIHEHYRYFGDSELVTAYRPAILSLLQWFEGQLNEEGLIGQPPPSYWNYFDWVEQWPLGAPTCAREGPMTLMSLMYATALEQAADLLRVTGWTQAADELFAKKQVVLRAVQQHCWSKERAMFRDGPQAEQYSQHAQVWAILAGAVELEDQQALLQRTMETADPEMARLSLPMSYYLFRALQSIDQYENTFGLWDRWLAQLDLGLTTLPEIDAPDTRSDCHAWSALPLSEFMMGILGVSSGWVDGAFAIQIQPHYGPLTWARGSVVTSQGIVQVDWKRSKDTDDQSILSLSIQAPIGISTKVVLPGGSVHHFNGGPYTVDLAY